MHLSFPIRFMWKNKTLDDRKALGPENTGTGKRTNKKKAMLKIQDITLIAMMVAVLEVCKMALSFLPNVELVTFWVIVFTIYFGWRIMLVIPVFILIECALYPLGLWVIMYLYAWPILALVTWLFRKQNSVWVWSIIAGTFGLLFGLLCAIPYGIIGLTSGGIAAAAATGFAWWVSGIPWDIVHCISNFIIMLVLYKPVSEVIKRIPFSVL